MSGAVGTTRHPELTALVARLRAEHPRPSTRWSELVGQIRAARAAAPVPKRSS